MMWDLSFWKQTVERAVKTAAQAGVAFFVIGTTGLADVDWAVVGGVAGAAAVASVLTSLASSPFGPENSPSLVKVEVK
jgi:hypothetical protein